MTDPTGAPEPTPRSKKEVKSRRGRRILAIILILLLLTLGLAVNLLVRLVGIPAGTGEEAESGGLEWVRSIYGMSDAADDQLTNAQMGAPDSDGSLWITDGEHGMLMHFSADGEFIGSLQGPEDSPLFAPARLTVGADDLLYVCEPSIDAVRVLDKNGNEVGSFNIPEPVSVAVTDDRIYVGAVAGFAILNKDGTPISIIGSRGDGDGEFDYVHGIAVGDDGTIYVTDSYNNRLAAYSPDGTRLWIERLGSSVNNAEMTEEGLTSTGAEDAALQGDDALQLPLGLTIDGAGRLVIVDMFDCTLAVFEPDGTFVAKYGMEGSADGTFFYPTSVAYDAARDWFIVADTLNNRVQIVRIPDSSASNGAQAAVLRALTGPLRACILPFLLLILALIVWMVVRSRRKKATVRQETLKQDEASADMLTEESSFRGGPTT